MKDSSKVVLGAPGGAPLVSLLVAVSSGGGMVGMLFVLFFRVLSIALLVALLTAPVVWITGWNQRR